MLGGRLAGARGLTADLDLDWSGTTLTGALVPPGGAPPPSTYQQSDADIVPPVTFLLP